METTTFLMILFVGSVILFWVPDIIFSYNYYKQDIKDFIKYLKFKFKKDDT